MRFIVTVGWFIYPLGYIFGYRYIVWSITVPMQMTQCRPGLRLRLMPTWLLICFEVFKVEAGSAAAAATV